MANPSNVNGHTQKFATHNWDELWIVRELNIALFSTARPFNVGKNKALKLRRMAGVRKKRGRKGTEGGKAHTYQTRKGRLMTWAPTNERRPGGASMRA